MFDGIPLYIHDLFIEKQCNLKKNYMVYSYMIVFPVKFGFGLLLYYVCIMYIIYDTEHNDKIITA